MFTGIIQSFGLINNIDKIKNIYTICTDLSLIDCFIGSSICCDGVCLTVTKINNNNNKNFFNVNIGEETIKRSNLVNWGLGKKINLEKSLKAGDEIAGHFVYGHVDTTSTLINIVKLKNSWEFEYEISSPLVAKFIAEKGSIAINGVSLTIASVQKSSFKVSIIPHTFENTNLSILKKKDRVNIEFDPIARYISKYYE